jgi:hypothetical protein
MSVQQCDGPRRPRLIGDGSKVYHVFLTVIGRLAIAPALRQLRWVYRAALSGQPTRRSECRLVSSFRVPHRRAFVPTAAQPFDCPIVYGGEHRVRAEEHVLVRLASSIINDPITRDSGASLGDCKRRTCVPSDFHGNLKSSKSRSSGRRI